MSRQRSAARAAAERELLKPLLRHGAQFLSPDNRLLDAAHKLADLGLVDLQRLRSVRCAHAPDSDFPPPNQHCDGLIDLRPGVDEGGGHYRCPRCERIVYPEADAKQQFDSLVVHHRQAGIETYLLDRCGALAFGRSFVGGVLTLALDGLNGFVCVVDYCTDDRWYWRSLATGQPCVYVTVGPDQAERILDEEAVTHVELVDIMLGAKDLRALLVDRAVRGPLVLANVDVPVYALGARAIALEPQGRADPHRVFHICLSPEGLLVDGLLAVQARRRATAMAIVRLLVKTYAEAVISGRTVEPMTADALTDGVEPFVDNVEDADSIARAVRRIRKSILDTVRQHTGKPIGEHDVIETVSRSGADQDAEGYRFNPRSVALGPLEP